MFYHISAKKGLKKLEPKISTHKQAWVYALKNPTLGLVFAGRDNLGVKADDRFTKYGITQNQIPEIFELYEGCLNEIFKNKDCYIYKLEDSGFLSDKTTWSPEWVSPNETKINDAVYIPDILSEIKKLEAKNQFIIHYYKNTKQYNTMVKQRIETILTNYDNYHSIPICLIKNYPEIVKDYISKKTNENFNKDVQNFSFEKLQEIYKTCENNKNNSEIFIPKEIYFYYPEKTCYWINQIYKTKSQTKKSAKIK